MASIREVGAMAYKLYEQYNCVWPGGSTPLKPVGFAIHWWGDPAQKPQFMSIVQLLENRAAQGSASVHFVAEAGQVACLTSPFEVAWAQGDGGAGWGNNHLISIECNPRCTAEDRETVAELIADQNIQNGIPIVLYPHNDFTSTQCPGVWEQWIPSITARAKAIVAAKLGTIKPDSSSVKPIPAKPPVKEPPVKPAPKPSVDTRIHWVVEKGDTLGKISQYYFNDLTHIAAIKSHNGIKDANKITPGQKIYIPGTLIWVIEAPDTIRSVAAYYGLDPAYLAKKNGLAGPDATIFIGNTLKIQ